MKRVEKIGMGLSATTMAVAAWLIHETAEQRTQLESELKNRNVSTDITKSLDAKTTQRNILDNLGASAELLGWDIANFAGHVGVGAGLGTLLGQGCRVYRRTNTDADGPVSVNYVEAATPKPTDVQPIYSQPEA